MIFKKAYPNNPLTTLEHLRQVRNRMLSDCDWTQNNDSPLTDQQKQSWATYRQQLRDLPQSYTDEDAIADIVYPNIPE